MSKTLIALAAASALAIGVAGATSPAEAKCGTGCAWGIGVGSFAAGAIVAGAARPGYAYYGYEPAPGYVAYTGYYGGAPVGCPGGYWARRPIYDQWGNQIGWSKPRFMCPY